MGTLLPRRKRVVAYSYSAILDERTCPLCRHLDGKVVAPTDPIYTQYQPPLHGNCRCIWIAITEEMKEETGIEITALDRKFKEQLKTLTEEHGVWKLPAPFPKPGPGGIISLKPQVLKPKTPREVKPSDFLNILAVIAAALLLRDEKSQAAELERVIEKLTGRHVTVERVGENRFQVKELFGDQSFSASNLLEKVKNLGSRD